MNTEQVEGQLQEYDGKTVSVALPIRGTCHLQYFGNLNITHNWEDQDGFILYSLRFMPDQVIAFRAPDVLKIIPNTNPNDEEMATIYLKPDDWKAEPHFYKHV